MSNTSLPLFYYVTLKGYLHVLTLILQVLLYDRNPSNTVALRVSFIAVPQSGSDLADCSLANARAANEVIII